MQKDNKTIQKMQSKVQGRKKVRSKLRSKSKYETERGKVREQGTRKEIQMKEKQVRSW